MKVVVKMKDESEEDLGGIKEEIYRGVVSVNVIKKTHYKYLTVQYDENHPEPSAYPWAEGSKEKSKAKSITSEQIPLGKIIDIDIDLSG